MVKIHIGNFDDSEYFVEVSVQIIQMHHQHYISWTTINAAAIMTSTQYFAIYLLSWSNIFVPNKIVQVTDFRIIPMANDKKETLINSIASSEYFHDIVIYNPTYSVE